MIISNLATLYSGKSVASRVDDIILLHPQCRVLCSCDCFRAVPTVPFFVLTWQLVSSFQQEAQMKQQESDADRRKLSNVRKMISKLLKSINEVRLAP